MLLTNKSMQYLGCNLSASYRNDSYISISDSQTRQYMGLHQGKLHMVSGFHAQRGVLTFKIEQELLNKLTSTEQSINFDCRY